MAGVVSKVAPFAPIFAVEVIDAEGFAWLYGPAPLHEALEDLRAFGAGFGGRA